MVLLWYASVPLLIVLLVQILRWRAYRLFPAFSAFVAFDIANGIARFLLRNHTHAYFVFYWITEGIDYLLTIAAFYEVYRAVFRGLTHAWWFRLILPVTVFSIAGFLAAHILFAPVQGSHLLFKLIITSELGMELLEGLTFVVLVACVAILGIRWRQYAFGITAGYGFYGTVALAATTHYSVFVTSSTNMWDRILVAAYSGTVLIWLWYFRKPQEPEPSGASEEFLQKAQSELELYRKLIRRSRDL